MTTETAENRHSGSSVTREDMELTTSVLNCIDCLSSSTENDTSTNSAFRVASKTEQSQLVLHVDMLLRISFCD